MILTRTFLELIKTLKWTPTTTDRYFDVKSIPLGRALRLAYNEMLSL